MKRAIVLLVTLGILVLAVVGVVSRFGGNSEYENVKSGLAAFDALEINCPDIHDTIHQLKEDGSLPSGPVRIAGLLPGYESTGRIVGKTAEGADIFGADGTVGVWFQPAPADVLGRPSSDGQSIAAYVVGLSIDFSRFDDEALAKVSAISTLESLSIENTAVTAEGLAELKRLPNLRLLCIGAGNDNLTEQEIGAYAADASQVQLVRDPRLFNP